MTGFKKNLLRGRLTESAVIRWLMARGNSIVPINDIDSKEDFKGPRIFAPDADLIAPDILIYRSEKALWVEVKDKSTWTEYKKEGVLQTGIDLPCWEDYLRIAKESGIPVYLLFLQRSGGPAGLYCGEVNGLKEKIHHTWHGQYRPGRKSGMVYWNIDALTKIADLEEIDKNYQCLAEEDSDEAV